MSVKIPQAYVFKWGQAFNEAALFNGVYDDVRSWILHNVDHKDYHHYRIYLEESQTYVPISQFMTMLKDVPMKIEDLQKAIDADVAQAKVRRYEKTQTFFSPGAQSLHIPGVQLEKKSDPVIHPKHYNMYDGIEIIQLTEQMNFNKGNAVKYIARAEFKGKEIEDLEKAINYLNYEIARIKRQQVKASS